MNVKRKAVIRGRTRVNIRAGYQRWRDLRELRGPKTDAALFLLDRPSIPAFRDQNQVHAYRPSSGVWEGGRCIRAVLDGGRLCTMNWSPVSSWFLLWLRP
ncbi:uncharacterized protein AKAME5_001328100 [Lates japonicus]|uniref:Uncharacterized protein n=1 Tax=Lates japonicus TaxID=270547 RepID=A0AAD3RA60_LATJO|nr:uncharacterized protein AKAME5_001328100 [Lates japonicus]